MVMNDSQENQHLLNNVKIVKIDNHYRFKCSRHQHIRT